MFHMKQKKRGGGPAREAGTGGECRRHAAGSRKDGRSEPIQWPGVPAAPALSARKAGFGGECRRHAAGSRCVRRLRRSNRPGPPPRLRGGAFVHFPPAESGQKGRRGAFVPKAKCPPEPPVRPRRGWLLQHPSPASAAGLRFSLWGTKDERHIPAPWLPLTRELSPQATEGENSQSVCSGYPALRRPAVSLPPSNPPGLPPPSSEGGKTKDGSCPFVLCPKRGGFTGGTWFLSPAQTAPGHCFM